MSEEQTTLEELENEPKESVLPESEDSQKEEKTEPEKPKENRYSKRVKELNTKYREAERRAAELERKLAEKEEATRLKKEPSPDDYDDGVVPEADKKRWENQLREQIRQEERENLKKQTKAEKQREAIEKGKQSYIKARANYVKEDPDFHKYEVEIDDAVEEYEAPEIQNLILESKELGPEIVKHFGKNPDDLLDIASSSPAKRFFKMGQLIAKLQAKPVKKSSSAPDPVRSEKGSATTIPTGKNAPYNPKLESWSDFTKRRNGL